MKKKPKADKSAPAEPAKDPAVEAYDRLVNVDDEGSFQTMVCLLTLDFKEHLYLYSLMEKARVLKLRGRDAWKDVMERTQTLAKARGSAGAQNLKDVEANEEEALKISKKSFGADLDVLEGMSDAETFKAWLRACWSAKVRPDPEVYALASVTKVEGRHYVFLSRNQGGSRRTILFAPAVVGEGLLYGGFEEQRRLYWAGPNRSYLFDLAGDNGRATAVKEEIEELVTSLMSFRRDVGRYPTKAEGLTALFTEPRTMGLQNWNGPYLAQTYDPWGRMFHYRVPSLKDPDFVDVWSAGPDGRSGTGDDVGSWE
jgi:general secretion pathway protein G